MPCTAMTISPFLRVLFIGFVLLRRAALGSGLWYHSRQTPNLVSRVLHNPVPYCSPSTSIVLRSCRLLPTLTPDFQVTGSRNATARSRLQAHMSTISLQSSTLLFFQIFCPTTHRYMKFFNSTLFAHLLLA